MGFFKQEKRKSQTVTVQGEDFTLFEPNALARAEYFDVITSEYESIKDDSGLYLKAKVNTKVDFRLIAMCLTDHFSSTADDIYKLLCDSITDFNDVAILRDAAEELAGLKIETTDSPGESSDTD